MHGDEEGRLSFKFLVKISSLGRRMENFYQNTQYIYTLKVFGFMLKLKHSNIGTVSVLKYGLTILSESSFGLLKIPY